MKSWLLILVAIAVVGGVAWMVLRKTISTNADAQHFLAGTELELVGKHGLLSIYLDSKSTNEVPDYALFEGNKCVVSKQSSTSNSVETEYFENGFNVLLTRRDNAGRILERIVSYDDGSRRLKYTYIDSNGDGLWDCFLDHVENRKFVRSNLCWVPSYPKAEK
jgi:hypothetical protein